MFTVFTVFTDNSVITRSYYDYVYSGSSSQCLSFVSSETLYFQAFMAFDYVFPDQSQR